MVPPGTGSPADRYGDHPLPGGPLDIPFQIPGKGAATKRGGGGRGASTRPKSTTPKRRRDPGSCQLFPDSNPLVAESLRTIPVPSSQFRRRIGAEEEAPAMTGSGAQRRAEIIPERTGRSQQHGIEEG
ncbi:hypothetical protein BHM03_00008720 [Ensete ventricosum]|nr:hypothetical protein BHM03_00008720 [Ensete ventricosum]